MGDSWEDDWDNDDDDIVEKALASKKEVRSEDEAEDSEEERRIEEEKRRAAAPKPKPKSKKEILPVQYDVPLKDKKAEKERLRKLEEQRDQMLAADLFAGVEEADEVKEQQAEAAKAEAEAKARKAAEAKVKVVVVDAFDKVALDLTSDVDRVLTQAMEKFEGAKAKAAAHFFLTNLLKQLEDKLTVPELDALTKSLAQLQKEKQVAKTQSTAEKKKGNEKLDKHTKFNRHDEMSVVYGGGGDWEDWDEDWDDWKE